MKNKFAYKVAVVTGAASGIGRSLSIQLAERGAHIAICDVDEAGLAETARRCLLHGGRVHTATVNVAEREAVHTFAEAVVAEFGTVNYVFNNAGVAFTGTIEHSAYKDIERVIDIDFWGVVNGTKAFLPHLIASGNGHVVNVSSVLGLFAMPTQGAYNAAKFAVRGFTEALAQEMTIAQHPVAVTCVHPGGIKTDIMKNSSAVDGGNTDEINKIFELMAMTTADGAAQKILDGVQARKPKVLVGPDAHLVDILVRLTGSQYQRLFTTLGGRRLRHAVRQA